MPTTHSYPTVNTTGEGIGIGKRNQSNLKAAFPGSPVYTTYKTTAEVLTKKDRGDVLATGPVTGVATEVNDGGYMFSTFDLTYSSAPDISKVETGGQGLPADPYYPNITSPGKGSTSPATVDPYTGEPIKQNIQFGSGLGATANPADTSKSIADQDALGSYISGRSYQGSGGGAS
tara:strand:+ start:880 stop:1404 length:525 start_codon:yes stop_codon:yes gene_type:complete